ncbi:hypothetical protein AAHC03_024553 [Spirometra sp. Aus1]
MNRNGPVVSSDRERTYLCWVNSKLSRLRPPVVLQALDEERVTNGTALADLLNVLSGSQLILKVPCLSRDDRIENIALLLKRLRELRVPVQSIREEDVADGEKNTIARLLLSMSASFMPKHVHDVKHEIQDRGVRTLSANKTHPTTATTYWRPGDHVCSSSIPHEQQRPQDRRYIQRPRAGSLSGVNGLHCNHKTLLLSNNTNGSLASAHNASSLGLLLKPSPSLNSFTYRQSSAAAPHGCGGSDIHLFSPTCNSFSSTAAASGGSQLLDRRCQEEYLRGGSQTTSPMRAAKSLSALPALPRRYVSRLFIPNLRQEAATPEDCTKKNRTETRPALTMRWRRALCFQKKHFLAAADGRFDERDEDDEEYMPAVRLQASLANTESHCLHHSEPHNLGNGHVSAARSQHGSQNGFINALPGGSSGWVRLDDPTVVGGLPAVFSRVSRFLSSRASHVHAARAPNKSVEAVRSRTASVASDGYVNHGFVDSPRPNGHPNVPLNQLAAFHRDLVSVRSDLLRLQEMLSADGPLASLTVAATSTSSVDSVPKQMDVGTESLNHLESNKPVPYDTSDPPSEQSTIPKILNSHTESFGPYPNETMELRHALLELTSAMKRLQAENNELRQAYQASHTPGSLATQSSRTSGLRNWSFSSESLSLTPCSPCDTTPHFNDALNAPPALI